MDCIEPALPDCTHSSLSLEEREGKRKGKERGKEEGSNGCTVQKRTKYLDHNVAQTTQQAAAHHDASHIKAIIVHFVTNSSKNFYLFGFFKKLLRDRKGHIIQSCKKVKENKV